MTCNSKGLSAKIFLGFLITAEVRHQLQFSAAWKETRLFPSSKDLVEVHFQGNNYLGRYFLTESPQLDEVKIFDREIREMLQTYCPECDIEKFNVCIFSQVFVS